MLESIHQSGSCSKVPKGGGWTLMTLRLCWSIVVVEERPQELLLEDFVGGRFEVDGRKRCQSVDREKKKGN